MLVDRHWGIIAANEAVSLLTEGAAPELLEPPANVLRLALHPDGVAPRIVNLAQLRGGLLQWLSRQAAATSPPNPPVSWSAGSAIAGEMTSCGCPGIGGPRRAMRHGA